MRSYLGYEAALTVCDCFQIPWQPRQYLHQHAWRKDGGVGVSDLAKVFGNMPKVELKILVTSKV